MVVPDGKYDFWWLMTTGETGCPRLCASKTNYGYVLVRTTRRKKCIQALEHRIVMEEWLCRKLHRHEDVHHINGDRADNRIENLLLCGRKEHFQFHPCSQETRAKMSVSQKARCAREREAQL